MENVYMCEQSQKGPQFRGGQILLFFRFYKKGLKTSICSNFGKVFKNEENHHILTPGQLKYKNSLIWMENMHTCVLSQKGSQVCTGRKL